MEKDKKQSNSQAASKAPFRGLGGQLGGGHVRWKPGNMVYPLPAVLVSCGNTVEEYNLFTVSWVGTVCTNPPMCYISVRPERYCNKFREMKLTPAECAVVGAPRVQQAPVSIECRVRDIIPLGSHDMFLADVVNVWADARYIDPVTGEFRLTDAHLIAYSHGHYHKLGEEIGKFGWSVRKRK